MEEKLNELEKRIADLECESRLDVDLIVERVIEAVQTTLESTYQHI